MNKEEIRNAFLTDIESQIKTAELFANDPHFDKLLAVCNSSWGYTFFHPFTSNFEAHKIHFPDFCEIYSWLQYCWDDDGSTSFVCATIEIKHEVLDKIRSFTTDDIFIMRGENDYLNKEEVAKLALKHGSHNGKMIRYVASTFYKEDIDFLFGLIPKWKEIDSICDRKIESAISYHKARNDMDALLKAHIESRKNVHTEVLP